MEGGRGTRRDRWGRREDPRRTRGGGGGRATGVGARERGLDPWFRPGAAGVATLEGARGRVPRVPGRGAAAEDLCYFPLPDFPFETLTKSRETPSAPTAPMGPKKGENPKGPLSRPHPSGDSSTLSAGVKIKEPRTSRKRTRLSTSHARPDKVNSGSLRVLVFDERKGGTRGGRGARGGGRRRF